MNEPNKLYLSQTDKMIGGLCGGLAEYFNIDSTMIRLLMLISVFLTGGFMIAVYIIGLFIIPRSVK